MNFLFKNILNMSKLRHLIFMYISVNSLCLNVRFYLRILKISLEMFLQVKIKIFMWNKIVYSRTHPWIGHLILLNKVFVPKLLII